MVLLMSYDKIPSFCYYIVNQSAGLRGDSTAGQGNGYTYELLLAIRSNE